MKRKEKENNGKERKGFEKKRKEKFTLPEQHDPIVCMCSGNGCMHWVSRQAGWADRDRGTGMERRVGMGWRRGRQAFAFGGRRAVEGQWKKRQN